MGKMKKRLMEVQENADQAFQDYVGGVVFDRPACPAEYTGEFAVAWKAKFNELENEYNDYLDQQAERYYNEQAMGY